tara:strand:+ start:7935 stop:9047 length:1113 start_codon:yes stop_codon:yes gene_type:complete
MTQDDITQEPNKSEANRGLSHVAQSGPKISDYAWYIGGALAVIGIIWINFGGALSKKDKPSAITTQQEEQYRLVSSSHEPAFPMQERINNGGQINQAPPIDPLLLQHQLRLQELERKKAEVAEQQAQARKRSPMLVYTQKASLKPQNAGGMPSFSSSDKGEQSSNAVLINAQKIQNQDYMIAQGTTISGVLETAIQSDLAGHLRAIVTRDIYSFDGSNILIPRGSKIIGQYQSNIKQGQSRLFVIWQRIIRPDGVDISLNSPGTDALGRAGLGGEVDTRFLERFGSAILLSMIDGAVQAGVNAASNTDAQTIVTSSGGALNNSAEIALKNAINIAPTIHVDQGTAINIFVTSDLDFSSTKPKRNNGSWWK